MSKRAAPESGFGDHIGEMAKSVSFRKAFKEFAPERWTVGTYLAARMYEVGIRDYFAVPGDYNLTLLDEILMNKEMRMIGCCNELNMGYAADGYSRAVGVSCAICTFTVGGLSIINAVAGAYSDNLPMLVISGGINSNDIGSNRVLHHTTGLAKKNQQFEMFEKVCAYAAVISHVGNAKHLIDTAFHVMLREKKPVYLEVSCNLAASPLARPCPFFYQGTSQSSEEALELAVTAASKFWNDSVKPVIVGGVKLRSHKCIDEFERLASKAGCAVAVMPNAKGMFREDHPNFIGTYWGTVSSPGVANIVESTDLYLFVGPIFNDYSTVGYSALLKKSKMILVEPGRVTMPDGTMFGIVKMKDFIDRFAKVVVPNSVSLETFKRAHEDVVRPPLSAPDSPLLCKHIIQSVQDVLTSDMALCVETGDAWFMGQKLKLPPGTQYEFQMQYGSIGWSVGALLGMALGLRGKKRCIGLIGDGSFQLTCQEVSTMIRFELDPIIIHLNNKGYGIEVAIHDGPYNYLQNWNTPLLIQAFNGETGRAKTRSASTEKELRDALAEALDYDGVFFIDANFDITDCTPELMEWGARVATANSRPHKDAEEVL
ncbi:Pyruvate decarboxylase 2 [Porphyridium purpureum]|uniref:pyruvate decarboxylase n=1 Tax=Porphyridium purpureum TaxID=35688 RepID=A0A5J4YMW1_PORPP|nr:Pyruvate decarboxylase 2 [Porphyridium purpureum]|eukprot:POR0764..scf295_9